MAKTLAPVIMLMLWEPLLAFLYYKQGPKSCELVPIEICILQFNFHQSISAHDWPVYTGVSNVEKGS